MVRRGDEGGRVLIYGLFDPRASEIAYVGKTVSPLGVRLSNHLREADEDGNKRQRWIAQLISEGVRPEIGLIEIVEHDEWDESERLWIEYFRSIGQAAMNTHAGGQGGRQPGFCMPESTRRKISEAKKGRPVTESQLVGLRAGWSRRKPGGWTDQQLEARKRSETRKAQSAFRDQEAVRLYTAGKTFAQVADHLNCSVATAYRAVTKVEAKK